MFSLLISVKVMKMEAIFILIFFNFFFLHIIRIVVLNCFISIDYDNFRDVWKKNTKKQPDRIVNIDKEKYEINSLHSCYDFIYKEIFVVRLSKNQYKSTVHSQFL
jgi:hypothetical protein